MHNSMEAMAAFCLRPERLDDILLRPYLSTASSHRHEEFNATAVS